MVADRPVLGLFGAFRSGTNYAKALLELNYEVVVSARRAGWKHAPVPGLLRGAALVLPGDGVLGVVKHPLSWLVSLWRFVDGVGARHFETASTFDSFLELPLTITNADMANFPRYRFASPADYWSAMTVNLLSLSADESYTVRYEDLLADAEGACRDIAERFDLHSTSEEFVHVTDRVRRMGDRRRSGQMGEYVVDEAFDPIPYREETHRSAFTTGQLEVIAAQLDEESMRALDYDLTSRRRTTIPDGRA
jgi:hypothetical protein